MSQTNPVSALVRTALLVSDLARSTRFYKDFLGLREHYLGPIDLSRSTALSMLALPQTASLNALILKAPGPNFGMIGLFELKGSAQTALPAQRDSVRVGESILVLYCADIGEKLTHLASFGGRLIAPPGVFHIAGASFDPVKEVVFRDPDGFAVNLIEAPLSTAQDHNPVRVG